MAQQNNIQPNEQLAMLWVKAQPIVASFIHAGIADFHGAEDVLQQVAQQAALRFDQYNLARPFTPWVIGIARNKIHEYRRGQNTDRLVFSEQALEMIGDAYSDHTEQIHSMREALKVCMRKLNQQARKLLSMRYQQDVKPGEIAQSIGLSANTVRIRLHRMRSDLAECIRRRVAMEEKRP